MAFILWVLYGLVTVSAWLGFKCLLKNRSGKSIQVFRVIFFSFSGVQCILLLSFYFFHFALNWKSSFILYNGFNGLLLSDFLLKIPFSTAFLLQLIIRKIRFCRIVSLMGIILSAGIAFVLVSGFISSRFQLHIRRLTLPVSGLPSYADGLKIAQISDSHLGNFRGKQILRQIVEANQAFEPDLLVFTGDFINNYSWECDKWIPYFRLLQAKYGKLAILGNHDYGDYSYWKSPADKKDNFKRIMEAYPRCGFKLLNNETAKISLSGGAFYITGVGNWGHPPFPRYADHITAAAMVPDSAYSLLLTHNPTHWDTVCKYDKRFFLALSGHTHGFQWGLKPAGIVLNMMRFLMKTQEGLYQYQGRLLLVNRGFGTIGIPLRIDMPAEITLITLKTK